MQKRNKQDLLILFFKSILMGTANKLPGISGGLVALITGFYHEMVITFKSLNIKTIKSLLRGDFKKIEKEYNGLFLVIVLSGIIVSYFTTSKILDYFFKISELNVWSFFFGMIIASLLILINQNKINNKNDIIYLSIGFSIGFLLSVSNPISENQNLLFVFFCGMISICGMIIPGISGSFLLILLGNYKLLLVDSVDALIESVYIIIKMDNFNDIDLNLIKILIVFSLGSVFGLILLSNILSWLINNYENVVNQIIIGFVSGSLLIIWPWKKSNPEDFNKLNNLEISDNYLRYLPDLSQTKDIVALACVISGLVIVLYIEKYASRKKNIWTYRGKN
tara:strand:+ start:3788 stop:4795 length:1008 start_codon:yes stop_codon:yes gene_type:complete